MIKMSTTEELLNKLLPEREKNPDHLLISYAYYEPPAIPSTKETWENRKNNVMIFLRDMKKNTYIIEKYINKELVQSKEIPEKEIISINMFIRESENFGYRWNGDIIRTLDYFTSIDKIQLTDSISWAIAFKHAEIEGKKEGIYDRVEIARLAEKYKEKRWPFKIIEPGTEKSNIKMIKRHVSLPSLKASSEFFLKMKEKQGYFQVNEDGVAYCSNYIDASHILLILTKKSRDDLTLTMEQMRTIKKKTSKKMEYLTFPTRDGDFYIKNVNISTRYRDIEEPGYGKTLKYESFVNLMEDIKKHFTGAFTISIDTLKKNITWENKGSMNIIFDKDGLFIEDKKIGEVSMHGSGEYKSGSRYRMLLGFILDYLKNYCRNVTIFAGRGTPIGIKGIGVDIGSIVIAPLNE